MILAMKKLPDGRWAWLDQPGEGPPVSVELESNFRNFGDFDTFTFQDAADAWAVFDALPPAELLEGPFAAPDEIPS